MNQFDTKKIEISLIYLQRMAEGLHPVKNIPVEKDSVILDPNVIRCMRFIHDVMEQVHQNGDTVGGRTSRQPRLPFPYEVLSGFTYMQDQPISHLMRQLKELAQNPDIKAPSHRAVTDWLKQSGYLIEEVHPSQGKKTTRATEKGERLGIYMNQRTSFNGDTYFVVMYNQAAQEFIVKNLEEIMKSRARKPADTKSQLPDSPISHS